MKILLKHQRKIDDIHYPAGTHDLPDSLIKHWYVNALIKDGDAVMIQENTGKEDVEKEELSPNHSTLISVVEPKEQLEEEEKPAQKNKQKNKGY